MQPETGDRAPAGETGEMRVGNGRCAGYKFLISKKKDTGRNAQNFCSHADHEGLMMTAWKDRDPGALNLVDPPRPILVINHGHLIDW